MNSKIITGVALLFVAILSLSLASAACSSCAKNIAVCNVSDLNAIRTNLSASYVQTCNIDLAGVSFPPIGTLYDGFRGVYNGNGYTISNFSYHNATGNTVGLFAANNGSIINVRLVNVNVSGKTTVGALVGANPGVIRNSHVVSGVVYGEGIDTLHFGGLVGYNGDYNLVYEVFTGLIENSSSAATVGTKSDVYVGGLAGINNYGATISNSSSSGTVYGLGGAGGLVGGSVGVIDYSHATGNVIGEGLEKNGCTTTFGNPCLSVGGLVGVNSLNGVVNRSYATGNVSGFDLVGGAFGKLFGLSFIENVYATGSVYGREAVGGFVGGYSSGLIQSTYIAPVLRNSYSVGNVSGWGDPFYQGGFAGWLIRPETNVTSSYWDIETSGQNTSALGIGKTTSEMYNQSTYTGWDFTNIWSINNGVDYPKLR